MNHGQCFTILWQQAGIEALQVLNSRQQWISVPPLPGTLVIKYGPPYIVVSLVVADAELVLAISLRVGQVCRPHCRQRVLTTSYRRCFQVHRASSC